MRITLHDGVYFTEDSPPTIRSFGSVAIELGGIVRQAQLKTLTDVKSALAKKAKAAGGNAIIRFQYGQKSVGFWRSILQLDDINWYGRGEIALLDTTLSQLNHDA